MVKIKTTNYNLFYGLKQALFDINMDIYKNKITAIIGPSGCGKSTLLRSFNRMNDLIDGVKAKGDIFIDDKSIYKDWDVVELRRKVGMVFQKPNPFPKSIFDNVIYGPRTSGIKDKRKLNDIMEKSLKQAALWDEVKDILRQSAMSLSGGQQQRLCIARAFAVKPEIILMDEATSSLDPISTAKIEELILELKKDYTIVVVTHSMQQAARMSDYTALLYLGKLIEYDKTEKIFTSPSNEITKNYVTGRFG
ncbi:MAG: phosphate ABC transporter ATP-binding protein [Desulfurellaceae bacterium]|nr:phosphate ABC transporter ATP-binding protein [Desulfurellaceae bacterium]